MVSAVAVGEALDLTYVVLDEEDRVVEVGPHAPAILLSSLGDRVHEVFPGTEPLYGPHYERARRTGAVVEFAQYSDGYVALVKAVPAKCGLIVSWELIGFVDVMTIEGLRTSLAAVECALSEKEGAVRRDRVRSSLRIVSGTG